MLGHAACRAVPNHGPIQDSNRHECSTILSLSASEIQVGYFQVVSLEGPTVTDVSLEETLQAAVNELPDGQSRSCLGIVTDAGIFPISGCWKFPAAMFHQQGRCHCGDVRRV